MIHVFPISSLARQVMTIRLFSIINCAMAQLHLTLEWIVMAW